MKNNDPKEVSRRRFLGYAALGLTGLTILPSWTYSKGNRIAPSDRIYMGFIGLAKQGLNDLNGFKKCPGIQVVACSDVDRLKRERFKQRVEAWSMEQNIAQRCDMYEFYEKMLERKDIDVISIATPDHWHALQTIHACQSGKDVFVQKPLSFTIREGFEMVKVVREYKTVLQVGSQQRSGIEFMKAINLIQSGAIGHITTIFVSIGDPPKPFDLPEHPVPDYLNWNLWLGPLNNPKVHYHPDLCPPISLNPPKDEVAWGAWRWYRECGNGLTADWGSHMFDIAQAAIGMDGSGPTHFIPKGWNGTPYLTMKYKNGIIMTEQPYTNNPGVSTRGIRFNGTKGWIEVSRGFLNCSDPSLIEDVDPKTGQKLFGKRMPDLMPHQDVHKQNFLDAVRSRKNPVAPVEVGCSTNTLCLIANIASELQRPVTWDPATLSFPDDTEAANHRLFHYDYRNPYSLYI